jgi:MoxR-like ATPase
MVIATQNPAEHHGTYPLPESQLDRFLLRIRIGYPDALSERQILRQNGDHGAGWPGEGMLHPDDVLRLQEQACQVAVDDSLADYILAIAAKTRQHDALSLGVSPRGTQALFRAAQAMALVEGRDYVIPDDIKHLVVAVWAHRVVVNSRVSLAQRGTETATRILNEIVTLVDVPL